MSAESSTEPSDDNTRSDTDMTTENEPTRDATAGDDTTPDGEVSRAFLLGLLAIGLLLFSLFAWAALTGRGSPL